MGNESEIGRLWARMHQWMERIGITNADLGLDGPLSELEIKALEKALGVQLPADFKQSLAIHNGQFPQSPGILWQRMLYSDTEIIDVHSIYMENQKDGDSASFDPQWVPFAVHNNTLYECLDLRPEQGGNVFSLWKSGHDVCAGSFTDALRLAVEDKESGREVWHQGQVWLKEDLKQELAFEASRPKALVYLARQLIDRGDRDVALACVRACIDALIEDDGEAGQRAQSTFEPHFSKPLKMAQLPRGEYRKHERKTALQAFSSMAAELGDHDVAIASARAAEDVWFVVQRLQGADRHREALGMLEDVANADGLWLRAEVHEALNQDDLATADRIAGDRVHGFENARNELRNVGDADERLVRLQGFMDKYTEKKHPWANAWARLELARTYLKLGNEERARQTLASSVFEHVQDFQDEIGQLFDADPLSGLRAAVGNAQTDDDKARANSELGLALETQSPDEAWGHLEYAAMALSPNHTLSKPTFEALERLEAAGHAQ
jgi:cell wall assembly regulator SMI1